MRTTKPVSTISFNSASFLRTKLEELRHGKIISFWAYIVHQPEDDEGGKKEHIHLFIEPSKMLLTDSLKEEFREFDPSHPDKPLCCISFRNSKFDDWYMYSIHNRSYLASKGESRRFHYPETDVVSSDSDDLNFRVKCIDLLALSPYADMKSAIAMGVSWGEYVARGVVPIPQINQFQKAYELLKNNATFRNGHKNHEMDVDSDSGEILE